MNCFNCYSLSYCFRFSKGMLYTLGFRLLDRPRRPTKHETQQQEDQNVSSVGTGWNWRVLLFFSIPGISSRAVQLFCCRSCMYSCSRCVALPGVFFESRVFVSFLRLIHKHRCLHLHVHTLAQEVLFLSIYRYYRHVFDSKTVVEHK